MDYEIFEGETVNELCASCEYGGDCEREEQYNNNNCAAYSRAQTIEEWHAELNRDYNREIAKDVAYWEQRR